MKRRVTQAGITRALSRPDTDSTPVNRGAQCAFCGKWERPAGKYLSYSLPWLHDPNDFEKQWCGCQEGRDAGVLDRLNARTRAAELAWASKTPLYDPDRPCPKCGNPIRTATFLHGYSLFGPNAFSPSENAYGWPHIKRYCGRCMFTDYEVPLDSQTSEPSNQ